MCVVIGLLYCIDLACRQGIAAWYFRKHTPEGMQAAIRWDPANPEYYDALGTLKHFYEDKGDPREIVRLYQTATRLSPNDPHYWADLGAAYEWSGQRTDAFRAFKRAQELFPHSPEINWRLANFYIRARATPQGLRALREVLLGGSVPRRDVFVLATNATGDTRTILDEMLPASAVFYFDYLDFLTGANKMDSAEKVWARLLELNLPFDLRQSFGYLDALIQHRETGLLVDTWSALAKQFPEQIHPRAPAGNLVTNGSFEFEILNGGLDWRAARVEGADVSVDSLDAYDGVRALRIDFDGTRNLDYWQVFQYVPVEPNRQYQFSGYMRVKGITTDSGPQFQIYDSYDATKLFYSTENLIGTAGWSAQRVGFKTGPDTHLAVVRVGRPASHKFDNRIGGTVWIDHITLEPVK
jgi:carbohydrate binding protein with CBM4/9 domain